MEQPNAQAAPALTFEAALDEVQTRFLLNLPEEELASADRLFFQLEQAWWFYEDFIADRFPGLPHFVLKTFARKLFQHCPLLTPLEDRYHELFDSFQSWKGQIPVAGCILLNPGGNKVVLVTNWKKTSRMLPRGKLNQGEEAAACAVRETWEECGYDATGQVGDDNAVSMFMNGQQQTMFIVTDVPEDFPFEPKTRKEVSAVEWHPLDAIPKNAWGVDPFLKRIKRYFKSRRAATRKATTSVGCSGGGGGDGSNAAVTSSPALGAAPSSSVAAQYARSPAAQAGLELAGPEWLGGADGGNGMGISSSRGGGGGGRGGGKGGRSKSAPGQRMGRGQEDDGDTFGGGSGGGWGFEAMMAANERLTGQKFQYDGNPRSFGGESDGGAPQQQQQQQQGGGGARRDSVNLAEASRPAVSQPEAALAATAAAVAAHGNTGTGSDWSAPSSRRETPTPQRGAAIAGTGVYMLSPSGSTGSSAMPNHPGHISRRGSPVEGGSGTDLSRSAMFAGPGLGLLEAARTGQQQTLHYPTAADLMSQLGIDRSGAGTPVQPPAPTPAAWQQAVPVPPGVPGAGAPRMGAPVAARHLLVAAAAATAAERAIAAAKGDRGWFDSFVFDVQDIFEAMELPLQ